MKIAVDGTALWGQRRYSGVEKVVDRILYRLCMEPRDSEIRILVPEDWNGFEEDVFPAAGHILRKRGDCTVERLPFSGKQKLKRIFWQQFIFPVWLRRWGADRVFCPTYVMPLLSPCPAVVIVHDLHGLDIRRTRPENFLHYCLVLPPTLRRARCVVTPTHAVLDELRPYLSTRCQKFTAPWGVDQFFTPGPAGDLRYTPYLLSVGNLEKRKGLMLLLEAFARVRRIHPNLNLVLAGKDQGLLAALQNEAKRLGVAEQVHFTGYVSQEELIQLYRGAAALALPSEAEGFGFTPLEAMACGTPVVAVDTRAVRENLGNAALYAAASPESLAAALLCALEEAPFRQSLREAGVERAALFTWERTMDVIWQALLAPEGRSL
ncbi:MAG: glycosyltransferase family 4 protein [Armatimonadota bacterium]|nr:glycosyltransferase family 4 protein [Armatimonadota bacterium]